ncbi:response regulator [Streptomyces qinzhouensis]|uniref:Response regulator transcription factor n=1 Tax=Streptomyces qinzhouensis TaxID=2599401 RepID=A0A5B8J7Z8_9ACTN|nr:response regulator transcription factor [Streptomyces qinzhouensis]QDY76534.1 response regulator transcription factor [Streptomyces qinzhouensis]
MEEMPRDHRPAVSVRILLAGDGGATGGALALLLGLEPGFAVVAQVDRSAEVVAAAQERRPDIALLDAVLPDGDGLEATARLLAEVPECRVLLLTGSGHPGLADRALAAGAVGLLVKDGPHDELVQAVHRCLTGETVIDPALLPPADPTAPPGR